MHITVGLDLLEAGHRPLLEDGHRPLLEDGHRPLLEDGHRPLLEDGHRPLLEDGHRPLSYVRLVELESIISCVLSLWVGCELVVEV